MVHALIHYLRECQTELASCRRTAIVIESDRFERLGGMIVSWNVAMAYSLRRLHRWQKSKLNEKAARL